ncbi:MAG: extracellular solute-binding protein [Lachnospiraceae bacterium]|nr:extracellular solute-binding protein [Lachnospiraceae bacterium]
MATIKDVALMAGVSIATVSNYLNHTKPVSKEVSAKIQDAIEHLKYTQNLSAKTLKSRTSVDIGVILPDFDNPYYIQLLKGIESAFVNTDYFLNIAISYDIPDIEKNIVQNFLKKQISGLIIISCQPDQWKYYYDHFTSRNLPIVMVDRDIHGLDANFIAFDNISIVHQMTSHLLQNQYRDIFLFSGPSDFECEENCRTGFQQAFEDFEISFSMEQMIKTNFSKENAFSKTIQLLGTHTPEAIVATSEIIATGVMEALRILGYKNDEIPVLTLGEAHWNLCTHTFSTVSAVRPVMKLGKTAAELLIQQLASPHAKETERIIFKNEEIKMYPPLSTIPPLQPPKEVPQPKEKLRILMLDTPQVHTFMGLLRIFEQKENIKTEVTIIPHHLLYDRILENYRSDTEEPFDILMYDLPWLVPLASKHILEDISDLMTTIDQEIFLPDCLKFYSIYNNHFYGIPFMYAPQLFYYRKDLFENPELKAEYERQNNLSLRPPLTLKEFNTIADFFTNYSDAIPYGVSIPASYDECLAPEIYMRMRAFGGNIFDKSGKVCFNSSSTLKAYISFIKSTHFAKPDYRNATDVSVVQDFLNGETAMLISYPSFLTDVADLRKSSIIGSIGYHHIPGRSPLLGGWSLGISSKSFKKDNAFQFLKWMCEEPIANYFTLLGGQTAITSTYTNDELNKLYPWLSLYHNTYQYAKPIISPSMGKYNIISQTDVDAIVCRQLYELMDEKVDVTTAIEKTHFDLESYLKQI